MGGGAFCKNVKNVENGFFVKVENGGCFFVEKWTFLNAECIMYSVSIFYFTFYLCGGVPEPGN